MHYRFLRGLPWGVPAGLLLLLAATAVADDAAVRAMRLRFEWGGGRPQLWSGVLEISDGRFEDAASLGVEADEPGTIWLDGEAVWIRRPAERVYDGFDVTTVAPETATVSLTLQSAGPHAVREQVRFPLSDLYESKKVVALGGSGSRLVVRRRPGDALKVHIDRPHVIYRPRARFRATVELNLRPIEADRVAGTIEWALRPARSKTVLQQGKQAVESVPNDGPPPSVPLDVILPEKEGAYDFVLRFRSEHTAEQNSTVQVVVLADERERSVPPSAGTVELVDSFDVAHEGKERQLAPREAGRAWNDAFRRLLPFLPAADDDHDSAHESPLRWAAYRMRVERTGRPHRLVVSLPADVRQNVGVSLVEPNAAGQFMPIGFDTGIAVDPSAEDRPKTNRAEQAEPFVKREVIVWPKVRDPILLLHNMNSGLPLHVERVELFDLGALETATKDSTPDATEAAAQSQPERDSFSRRWIGPYMHKPLLPENFGATEAFDESSRRSLDDWVTFHTAALRLVDYLEFTGFNSLMVSASADGSTIYPSRLLQPTARYDTGAYFSTGQDPLRKDVLELLYRMFDRRGMVLVPLLQFSTPLPALETALAREGDAARGLELIGRDGRSWRESRGSARGLAPYYNPLSPRVQQTVLAVVRELVERYKSHASFGGVAVELSSVGYLQFPGLNWGYDDETISRFTKVTGIKVPQDSGPDRFRHRYEFLTQKARRKWVAWRTDELARFHRKLAETVTSAHPTARFVLAGNRVLRGGNPDDDVDALIRAGGQPEKLLAPKGLDFQRYNDLERLVLLRPVLWGLSETRREQALDSTLNESAALGAAYAAGQRGCLFYHAPRECRIPQFDAVSPWQPAYTWLAAPAVPDSAAIRRGYTQALASGDAQALFLGSWTVALAEDDSLRDLRRLLVNLPATDFHTVPDCPQPVTVRIARHQKKTYIYAVNEFRSPTEVRLRFSKSPNLRGRSLAGMAEIPLEPGREDKLVARFELQPYGVWACELSDGSVRIDEVEVVADAAAVNWVQRRLRDFEHKLAEQRRSGRPKQASLRNPGFEATGIGRQLSGWDVPAQNAVHWTIDRTNPRSGRSSLMLASDSETATLVSPRLPIDECRLVAVSAWLRSDRDDSDVRLAFDATVEGRQHTKHTTVRVGRHWRRFQFTVRDLPGARLQDPRVRVESLQPGKVWIDDVEIQTYEFSPEELRQLMKVYSSLTLAWDEKRYADCRRLLEGYWAELLFENASLERPRTVEPQRTKRGLSRLLRDRDNTVEN